MVAMNSVKNQVGARAWLSLAVGGGIDGVGRGSVMPRAASPYPGRAASGQKASGRFDDPPRA